MRRETRGFWRWRAHPDRLVPACSLTPWRGDEGRGLLRDAAGGGAKMLVLAPMLQGFIPSDEVADPLLQLAGELRMPVYVHTGPHAGGTPAQALLMAEKHPDTRFIFGHCGSTDHV